MREAKDGFFCVTIGCERWVEKEAGKPAYWKHTWAIPEGGWVYSEDGHCFGWFAFADIIGMGIYNADRTVRC
jgi:hypothetical protein